MIGVPRMSASRPSRLPSLPLAAGPRPSGLNPARAHRSARRAEISLGLCTEVVLDQLHSGLFLFVFCLQACSFIHVPLCPFVCSSVFNSPMTLQRLALLLFVVLLLLQQQRLRFRMDSRAPWVQYVPVHIRLLIVFI